MSDYIPMYKRPEYVEAFELGKHHGKTGKSGMDAYYHGGIEAERVDKEKLGPLNFAYLSGWFTGAKEREENPVEEPAIG